MPNKNSQFYSEVVLVTILSLIAANAWIRLMTQLLNKYFPGSIKIDLIVAIVMTMIAIFMLQVIFVNGDDRHNKKDEDINVAPLPYYE